MENYNIEGYQRLAAAVVERAVIDYTRALRKLQRRPSDQEAEHTVEECERFFRRDMEMYSDLDGESIIRAVRNKVDAEMRH